MRSVAKVMVDMCAYAGTGNVLKIQELLHICSEHYGEKPEGKQDGPLRKVVDKCAYSSFCRGQRDQ